MTFLTLIIVAVFLMSTDPTGYNHFVATFTTSSSSKPSFLLTTGSSIIHFSPGEFKTTLISGLSNAVHLDVTFLSPLQEFAVFWTDTKENKIYRSYLKEHELVNQSVIVNHGVSSLSGLAVDSIRNNVYWVDEDFHHVEVCRSDGTMRTLLLDKVYKPSNLVIDSAEGLLFWVSEKNSGQESFPIIERSFLDGTGRETVMAASESSNGKHGYVLTVYQDMQELFWLDTLSGSIYCSNYDGSERRIVKQTVKSSSSVFGLVVTRNSIYWTDKVNRILVKASCQYSDQVDTLTIARPSIYGLKLINLGHTQSAIVDVSCAIANGGCSHLCLSGIKHSTCKCPYGLELLEEGKSCKERGPILGFIQSDRPELLSFVQLHNSSHWVFPPIKIPHDNLSLAFDPVSDVMYRIENKRIVREAVDGSTSELVLDMGYFQPLSLALDWHHGNLYVMSEKVKNRGLVTVVTAVGASLTHLHWENIWTPGQLALDLPNMYLFWSHVHSIENSTDLHILEISELDGSNRRLFYHSDEPMKSIATDPVGRQLCWINTPKNLILCKGYKTWSSVYTLPAASQAESFVSMTVYQESLLYTNDQGQLYALQLRMHNQTMLLMNASSSLPFVTIIPPKAGLLTRKSCDSETMCLPNLHKASGNNKKVDHYLLYTEDGLPHTLSLHVPEDFPELIPHPLFRVPDGDKIDVLPGQNSHLVWLNQADRTIYSVRRDGRNQTKCVSVSDIVGGIAVDHIAGNLYWSFPTRGEIWVSRINGKHPYIVHSGKYDHPSILALSAEHGYLFWFSCGLQCVISRSTLSGSDLQVLHSNLSSVSDLAVEGVWLYWTSPELGVIQRSDLNGERKEVMLKSENSFSPYSLAVEGNVIYWTDRHYEGGSIVKKNGSSISVMKRGLLPQQLLVVNESAFPRYASLNPCGKDNGGCAQLCLFSGHMRNTCYCSHGHLAPNRKDCQKYSSFLVYSNRNKVESVRVDNPNDPNPPLESIGPLPNKTNIVALAYDLVQGRIYFNDLYRKPYLFSVHTNGSGLRSELEGSDRTRHIEGLALDPVEGLLLWTESTHPSIWSLSPRKRPEKILALSSSDKPRGIVLHYCSRRLFWTNWNLARPGIETCILGQCSDTYKFFLSTHSWHPNALTLQGGRLFWSETSPKTREYAIHSCHLDGTQHQVHVSGTDANPFALVVLPNLQALWTDFENGRLCWADLHNGSNGCHPIRNGLDRPLGLTLVDPSRHMNDCLENGKLPAELFSYGCVEHRCNLSESSGSPDFSDSFVGPGNEYSTFHKNLFIGAGVAGMFLVSVTVLFVFAKIFYYGRKQAWSHLKAIAQKERTHQERVQVHINPGHTNSLLELDDVTSSVKDEKVDDEQHLILYR